MLKISIITATYNSSSTIADCITSVNEQTYPHIEHIIVDGLSKDNTLEIIKDIPNRVERIISERDKGIYDAMNKGIKVANGDIIGTLNSDDTLFDSVAIEKIARFFLHNPEIDCMYGNLVFVNESKQIQRRWKSRPFEPGSFARSWTPAHPTFYCKREIFEKFGLYKTDYKIAADVEFMLKVLEVEKVKSSYLNEVLVSMALGGVSTSGLKSTITITKELKRAFKENGLKLNLLKYLFFKALKIKEYL